MNTSIDVFVFICKYRLVICNQLLHVHTYLDTSIIEDASANTHMNVDMVHIGIH